jgi:hypothetical protein
MSSLIVYNANLTHYGAWALQNNMILDGQNHFYEIDSKLLSTCVDKMFIANSVITYEQLIHSFNQFNSHMDKYLVFALFEGIKGKDFSEITDLRIEDWTEETFNTFTTAMEKYKKTAESFTSGDDKIEADSTANSYQVSFVSEDGNIVTKRFERTETTKRGALLSNQIQASLDSMGQSISEQEKRQILMDCASF